MMLDCVLVLPELDNIVTNSAAATNGRNSGIPDLSNIFLSATDVRIGSSARYKFG